jgi:hypothetical protein
VNLKSETGQRHNLEKEVASETPSHVIPFSKTINNRAGLGGENKVVNVEKKNAKARRLTLFAVEER